MVEVQLGNKDIKRTREFIALEAVKENKMLRISYRECTLIDDEVVKTETKSYMRNYDEWEESQLGVAILAMVSDDLGFDEPQTKGGQFDEQGNRITE
jgi:hypothetical protein